MRLRHSAPQSTWFGERAFGSGRPQYRQVLRLAVPGALPRAGAPARPRPRRPGAGRPPAALPGARGPCRAVLRRARARARPPSPPLAADMPAGARAPPINRSRPRDPNSAYSAALRRPAVARRIPPRRAPMRSGILPAGPQSPAGRPARPGLRAVGPAPQPMQGAKPRGRNRAQGHLPCSGAPRYPLKLGDQLLFQAAKAASLVAPKAPPSVVQEGGNGLAVPPGSACNPRTVLCDRQYIAGAGPVDAAAGVEQGAGLPKQVRLLFQHALHAAASDAWPRRSGIAPQREIRQPVRVSGTAGTAHTSPAHLRVQGRAFVVKGVGHVV